MNSLQEKTGRRPLQGPRPAPLRVSRESHQIRKPLPPIQQRGPVIVYAQSPEIIHADVGEFKTLVQSLIGQPVINPDLYSQPSRAPGFSDSLSRYPNSPRVSNSPRASNSNLSPFSLPEKESEKFTCKTSPASPNIPSNLFSPLSPSLFLPSPKILSPNLFKDLPLFTPQLQSGFSDIFFSPGHIFLKQSELLFTPPSSIIPHALWSPSSTVFDLTNRS